MPSFIFLLSLTISFSIFPSPTISVDSPAPVASDAPTDLITKACASTPNRVLCEQTINADTKTPKKDINDLAFIAFEAASTKTVANIEYITRTTDLPETEHNAAEDSLKQIFQNCEQQYEGAVDDVDNSVNYLASRTKEDDKQIHGLLTDAVQSIDACHKNIEGKGPPADQLSRLNQEVLDLLNNALGLFHLINLNTVNKQHQ